MPLKIPIYVLGTTWAQELVWLICNGADTEAAKEINLEDRFPYLEHPFSGTMQSSRKKNSLMHIYC